MDRANGCYDHPKSSSKSSDLKFKLCTWYIWKIEVKTNQLKVGYCQIHLDLLELLKENICTCI
jgi:hypothetical protein